MSCHPVALTSLRPPCPVSCLHDYPLLPHWPWKHQNHLARSTGPATKVTAASFVPTPGTALLVRKVPGQVPIGSAYVTCSPENQPLFPEGQATQPTGKAEKDHPLKVKAQTRALGRHWEPDNDPDRVSCQDLFSAPTFVTDPCPHVRDF